jgi:alpha-2-macroglobulin
VVTEFGGLEVTTSSTQLQALTDAFLYLVTYPFECAEQRSSRVLSIAALRDVLTAFKAEGLPTVAAMQTRVAGDLERLENLQNGDGGFPFWERGRPSWPYLTVYVTNALVHAKQKGYAVPQGMLDRAKAYLRDIESHYDNYYPKEVRWSISAFALYTRKLMGDLDLSKGKSLIVSAGGVDKLPMEANGWLLGTFAGQASALDQRKAILRHAGNRVSETAGAANFTTSYADGGYLLLSSDRRVDAVMLEALIAEQKDSDLIPKLVTGLLAHKKRGRWENTQENTFVLVALDQYFNTYEKVTPDFVARVWLGNGYAGDHPFKGRSTDSYQIDIPMKTVAAAGKSDLVIQKDGAGRLYYRVGMTYAPADLKLAAADYGFVVERRYEGVDNASDVVRQPDGTWKIKAGARVRVRLTMVNENRRYHVALVDPLPAGLEAMNPALAVTGPIPLDPQEQQSRGAYWWWYGPWYEHQNLRDERIEAFASLLWEGVHTYEYVARATTPGNFVVPPPKAEEMYMPETFGRGASDRVIIE